MTASEWDACTDPDCMLSLLTSSGASERKLRLHLAAICRCLRPRLMDERSREAVRIAELFADGIADKKQLATAYQQSHHVLVESTLRWSHSTTLQAVWLAGAVAGEATNLLPTRVPLEKEVRVALIREIFGGLRPTVIGTGRIDSTVVKLARAVYEDQDARSGLLDNARLGVLADVLEESGINDAKLLGHLRGNRFHFRGCFALDAILGRS